MDKRWLAFFLFTFGLILLFNSRMETRRQEYLKTRREAAARELREAQQSAAATSETLHDIARRTPSATTEPSLRPPTDEEEDVAEPLDYTTAPTVTVETRDLRVVLSTRGGLPLRWELLNLGGAAGVPTDASTTQGVVNLIPEVVSRQREYPLNIEGRPLELFNEVAHEWVRQELPSGEIVIIMSSEPRRGLQVIRTYRFPPEGHIIELTLLIQNYSEMRRRFDDGGFGFGIGWQGGFLQPEESSRAAGDVMALISKPTGLSSEHMKIGAEPIRFDGPIHWAGIERKFFLVSIVPDKSNPATGALVTVRERDVTDAYRKKGISPPVSVVLNQERFELEPQQSAMFHYRIFSGPKTYDTLQSADVQLELGDGRAGLSASAFHSTWKMIRWLTLLLLRLLKWLEELTQNYGVAIILLTVIVRVVVYPLTHKSLKIQAKTMAQQAKLKPHIEEINKKYKDNPSARNQAIMKLWKEHNINPFGMLRGCVPVLLQMPVFIALYVLLDQAIELRGQSFLWIRDLSLPDRLLVIPGMSLPFLGNSLNLLPILMGATQVITSKMSMSAATDPTQRQIMLVMPVMFVFFLYNFPSGLMLYWVVTNTWQIGQQAFTNRLIQREQEAAPA
jgi:YidC/Oxa1 family membrane protein insertase